MQKIKNKLDRINKRIEDINKNPFYCDNSYKLQQLKNKDISPIEKMIEEKYINLRYEELYNELQNLYDLEVEYKKLVMDILNYESDELNRRIKELE